MWVEVDPEKHHCAMLSFFPAFEYPKDEPVEYTFLLDCSASMKVREREKRERESEGSKRHNKKPRK
jgi:hypothetical protein